MQSPVQQALQSPYMPAILALFGTLITVIVTAWLNTRALMAHVDAVVARVDAVGSKVDVLRADTRKDMAEFELRLTKEIIDLQRRIERLEEQRGLVRP